MTATEMLKWAKSLHDGMESTDVRLKHCVFVVTKDSFMFIKGAFHVQHGEFAVIISEHHGFFVHHQDELLALVESGDATGADRLIAGIQSVVGRHMQEEEK